MLEEVGAVEIAAVFSVLPFKFWTLPTSEPSEVAISILFASLYSPGGTSLSSRSLFIRALENVRFNSGIY